MWRYDLHNRCLDSPPLSRQRQVPRTQGARQLGPLSTSKVAVSFAAYLSCLASSAVITSLHFFQCYMHWLQSINHLNVTTPVHRLECLLLYWNDYRFWVVTWFTTK
ncbi:hypothetical protein DL93DRAFT_548651 [Clavulina sp. PMI_390]|nr:hypothetical protein DL93DRAFT_548651 [Clavulina sp. PMI_390]